MLVFFFTPFIPRSIASRWSPSLIFFTTRCKVVYQSLQSINFSSKFRRQWSVLPVLQTNVSHCNVHICRYLSLCFRKCIDFFLIIMFFRALKALRRTAANHSSALCADWSSNARATGRGTWSSTRAWKATSAPCAPFAVLEKTISSPTWRWASPDSRTQQAAVAAVKLVEKLGAAFLVRTKEVEISSQLKSFNKATKACVCLSLITIRQNLTVGIWGYIAHNEISLMLTWHTSTSHMAWFFWWWLVTRTEILLSVRGEVKRISMTAVSLFQESCTLCARNNRRVSSWAVSLWWRQVSSQRKWIVKIHRHASLRQLTWEEFPKVAFACVWNWTPREVKLKEQKKENPGVVSRRSVTSQPCSFSRYISTRTAARRSSANSAPSPPPVTSASSSTCAATSTSRAPTSRWKRSWPPTRRAKAPWWATAARRTWGARKRRRCTRTPGSRRRRRPRPPPITSTSRRSLRRGGCPCCRPSAWAGSGPAAAPTPSTFRGSGSGPVPAGRPPRPSSAPTSAPRRQLTCLWSFQVRVVYSCIYLIYLWDKTIILFFTLKGPPGVFQLLKKMWMNLS